MNYLAHVFLGSSSHEERVGQLLADEVKGMQYRTFPAGVQRGILMHRWVDATTDSSPHLEQAKKLLHGTTGRVTPIALDVIMDHFMSVHWDQYHSEPLPEFIATTYSVLEEHRPLWPAKSAFRLEHLIQNDWLGRYATLDGIALTMKQMAQRKSILHPLPESLQVVEKHRITFENTFHLLIRELIVGYKSKINTFATLPPV